MHDARRIAAGCFCLMVTIAGFAEERSPSFTPDKPLPDIPSLLARVRDHQDEVDRMRENFTCQETVVTSELDKHGTPRKKTSEVYELTFFKHRAIERLVQKDGSPLSSEKQAKEDARVQKLIRDLDEGKAVKDPGENRRMKLAVFLRAEKFSNPRREQFRGRDVVVFDFDPDPAFKSGSSYEAFYGKIAGTMSVDEAELEVTRVDFRLIEDFKVGGGLWFDMKKGAHFVGEQGRFFDRVWLPTDSEVQFGARAMMFYGFGINSTTTYGDYRRFNVSATENTKLPTAPNPQ